MFGFSRNPERHQKIGRAVRVVVGLILLASAALKLDDLLYGEATALLWLPSPRWVFAAIEVEALVGLWLLSGWQARWAWGVATGFIVILATISLSLALEGEASCGCFGHLSSRTSPWWMFCLDLILLLAAGSFPPKPRTVLPWSSLRHLAAAGFVAFVILGLADLILSCSMTTPWSLMSSLRSGTILVSPELIDTGSGSAGE